MNYVSNMRQTMRYLLLILLLLVSCEDSQKLADRSSLSDVDIKTTHVSTTRKIIHPDEASTIQTSQGTITVPKETFSEVVITEVQQLESGEGIMIDTLSAEGDYLVPQKDIEVCLATRGDANLKDIKTTSTISNDVTVSDGTLSGTNLCVLTRTASGRFEVINEKTEKPKISQRKDIETNDPSNSSTLIDLNRSVESGYISLTQTGDIATDKTLSDHIVLANDKDVTGAIRVDWSGDSAIQSSILSDISAEVCLEAVSGIQTITQVHNDGSLTHHLGTPSENDLFIVPNDIYGQFIPGPLDLTSATLDSAQTILASAPKIDVGPLQKDSTISRLS